MTTAEQAPNPTPEQADRISMEVLDEYRKIAAWLESQAAVRGPAGDTMHGLAAEALTTLINHEYSRHTIPLYGMLDVWRAIHGTSHPEFDEFYAEHGYAETWARLLDSVRRLRAHGLLSEGAPSEEQIERAKKVLADEGFLPTNVHGKEHYEGYWSLVVKDALTAAGVAPQEPKCEHGIALIDLCQFADQVANDESDPQEPSDAWVDRQLAAEVAAKSGKPAPLTDREKLIAEAGEYIERQDLGRGDIGDMQAVMADLLDALAAQPVLDSETVTSKATAKNGVCLICGDGVLNSGEHIDPERHGHYLADLLAEATVTWETAGRMPQGAMVHETQWKPFAALYNVTERLIDALSAQLTLDEGKVAEVVESSAAEWGDSARVQAVLAQYIARALCVAYKEGELT